MYWQLVFKVIGVLLIFFSLNLLPVILVSLIYNDNQWHILILSWLITATAGLLIWLPFARFDKIFRVREGIVLVVGFWTVLSAFATLPFLLSPDVNINITNAFFESMSGLTTTGATIFDQLDGLPKSILYYRQQLQWLGGMGIIVLAVSILPILGVGGTSLYKAEHSGISQEKLTPKIAQTARVLWRLYAGLTLVCACAYYLAGMNLFDAIGHSFSTIAIGGFSTHDLNLGYYDSAIIEMIATVFMLIAGVNFSLHFIALQQRKFSHYLADSEFKAYIFFLILLLIIIFITITNQNYYEHYLTAIRHVLFHVVSIATTTGFTTQSFYNWPVGLPILLILASFVGACAGSTGGGIKVVRVVMMFKLGAREIKRLIHPSAQINIKLNKRSIPEHILGSVWGFFALYVIAFIAIVLMLLLLGLNGQTAFSATAASINNLGPALGEAALNYKTIDDTAKWILSIAMLLGRLEIITLMALLHKAFWRY